MENTFPYRLYLVISGDSCGGRDFLEVAEQAVLGGVDLIQLREKKLTTAAFIKRAEALQKVLDPYQIPLIINDNLEVARAVKANGIHVGTRDTPPSVIKSEWQSNLVGYSIENLSQLDTIEAQVSDCLAASPVYKTATKTDTIIEWGLEGISKIRSLTKKPLIAIGNMNAQNAYDVIRAGADCIAVVSAICQAEDPKKAAMDIREQIEKAV